MENENGTVFIFERHEEINLDESFTWIEMTKYPDYLAGRKVFIRGVRKSGQGEGQNNLTIKSNYQ